MDTICYSGVGSVEKSGNHTKKKYLDVMNKKFNKRCSIYIKSLKCKSCKKAIIMNTKENKKQIKALIQNKPYKMSKNTKIKILKQKKKCNQCIKNNTKKCNLKNYMLFSGAEFGKCKGENKLKIS